MLVNVLSSVWNTIHFIPKRVSKKLSGIFSSRVVEFASYSDLKNALEKLSGKEMNGRKIKLIEAAKKR